MTTHNNRAQQQAKTDLFLRYLKLGLTGSCLLFLAIILLSYNPHDPSWFYSTTRTIKTSNWGGAFGAHMAALLIYLFGTSALTFIITLGCYFSSIYHHKTAKKSLYPLAASMT